MIRYETYRRVSGMYRAKIYLFKFKIIESKTYATERMAEDSGDWIVTVVYLIFYAVFLLAFAAFLALVV